MVVTRSIGNLIDLKKYLAAVFISREKEFKYFTFKIYQLIKAYSENVRRNKVIKNPKYSKSDKIEAYLLNKLELILRQKNQEYFSKIDNMFMDKRKRDISDYFGQFEEEKMGDCKEEENIQEQSPAINSKSKDGERSRDSQSILELDPESFDPSKIIPNGVVEICCFKD
jgi:hypothetical protein